MKLTRSEYVWKGIGAFLVLTATLMAAFALPEPLETKVCGNLNLTIQECNTFLDDLYNVSTVTQNVTRNVTNNITQIRYVNTTQYVTQKVNVTLPDDSKYVTEEEYKLQRLEDKTSIKLELKDWIREELKDEEIIQVIERNFTQDLSEYATKADVLAALNKTPEKDNDYTLLYIGLAAAAGLFAYNQFRNRRSPPPEPQYHTAGPRMPDGL